MANALLAPSEGGKVGKSSSKGKGKGGKTRALAARFAAFKGSDLGKLAVFTGEFAGSVAIASAAKGYFGDRINLWGIDGRLIAGALAFGVGQFGVPGVMKAPAMGQDLANVGLGILASWIGDQAFEMGGKMKPAAAPEATPAAEAPAASGYDGLVHLGSVDEVGMSEKRKARIERRLERKFGRLKRKADKADIDWKDVRTPGEEPVRPRAVRVLPPPPGAIFRPRAFAARHPRYVARHPRFARRFAR